jgi:hypothetical protein
VLQTKVVVEMARAVLLDDERERASGLARSHRRGRLRRHTEVALAIVFGETAVLAEVRKRGGRLSRASTSWRVVRVPGLRRTVGHR